MGYPQEDSVVSKQKEELQKTSKLLAMRRYAYTAYVLTISLTILTFAAGFLLISSKQAWVEAFPKMAVLTAVITIIEVTVTLLTQKSILGKSRPTVLKREISAIYFMNLKKALRPSGGK